MGFLTSRRLILPIVLVLVVFFYNLVFLFDQASRTERQNLTDGFESRIVTLQKELSQLRGKAEPARKISSDCLASHTVHDQQTAQTQLIADLQRQNEELIESSSENLAQCNELKRGIENKEQQNSQLKLAVSSQRQKIEGLESLLSQKQSRMTTVPNSEALDPIPILLICYNRVKYLQESIESILEHRPSRENFPLIVSQDQADKDVWDLISLKYQDEVVAIQHLGRKKPEKPNFASYYYISEHYRFALSTIFDKLRFKSVIVLEEDIIISPDFFQYFAALKPLLENDPTLFCISAWNDNGKKSLISDPTELRRSDFFPGLGWMITSDFWEEIKYRWPNGFWDDWMRETEQRRGRHCIFPEISRAYTIGREGASHGQFFDEHLQHIALNQVAVNFSSLDLSYLEKEQWETRMLQEIEEAQVVETVEVLQKAISMRKEQGKKAVHDERKEPLPLAIFYRNYDSFKTIARSIGIMDDERAGILRTGYNGVIKVKMANEIPLFIVPTHYKDTFRGERENRVL